MEVRATCGRCGASVLSKPHAFGDREILALTAHLHLCAAIPETDRPARDAPLGQVLRYFRIAIDVR